MLTKYAEDKTIRITFKDRHISKPYIVLSKRKQTDYSKLDFYYVLMAGNFYLWKLTSRLIYYTVSLGAAKKFQTEKKANDYLKKHSEKIPNNFTVVRIENGGAE